MPSLNQVFLIGNLTRDPELRRTPTGIAVASLGMAINRKFTTKDGEVREEVTYVDLSVWDRQAESCAEYLRKGSSIHVDGRLKMESWDDKATGSKRYKLTVEAERVQFLDGKPDDAGQASGQDRGGGGKWGGSGQPQANTPQRQGGGNQDFGDRPPGTGKALFAWAMRQKDGGQPDILKRINEWGKGNRLPDRMTEWPDTAAVAAYEEIVGAGR